MTSAIIFVIISGLVLLLILICFIFSLIEGEDTGVQVTSVLLIPITALLVISIINVGWKSSEYTKELYNIVSIRESNESFTLGVGNQGSCTYYYYYAETDVGNVLSKQNANYTTILKDDTIQPYVLEIKERGTRNKKYEIYVPSDVEFITFLVD